MAKKTNIKLRNPFVYQGYVSPNYFCDRAVETEELIGNLQNGCNTVLISPRRIGKTGLIKNAFYKIKETEKDAICVYVDIYSTKNQQEFVQFLGTAIYRSTDCIHKHRTQSVNSVSKEYLRLSESQQT
jgi:Ni2+-binding GTPase involved in maturation of urease and hydrogenase